MLDLFDILLDLALPISLRVCNLFPMSYWMHSPEGNPISQQLLTSSNPNRTFLPPVITTNATTTTTNKLFPYPQDSNKTNYWFTLFIGNKIESFSIEFAE